MSWKLANIARLDRRRPKAVRLALLASLAARIEPALLRRLRLEVGPDLDLDVGSEADLWFSPLVESRNPVAMVLRPDAAAELRREFYGHDPDRARRARQVVTEVHAQAPPTIQLLESLAWLALSEAPQLEVEKALRPLIVAVFRERRLEFGEWAHRISGRLDPAVRETAEFRALLWARPGEAATQRVPLPEGMKDWLIAELTGGSSRRRNLPLAAETGAIILDVPPHQADYTIETPDTDPLLLDILSPDSSLGFRTLAIPRGRPERIAVPLFPVEIRTPAGDVYSVPIPIAAHNLPPLNPNFVGRENVLAAIREALTKNAPGAIAITGLGGVGKTQTALAYCYHHLADYRLIWWLRAAESATLSADFMALAGPLGLPEERDQAKVVQTVKAKLQANAGWLLIFDNTEDPATVWPYLPRTGASHILITSRLQDWAGTARVLALDVLIEEQAVLLLLGTEASGSARRQDAVALARDLDFLPLALAQARAFMQARKVDIATYRQQLAAARPKVLAWRPANASYPLAVAQAWQASIGAAIQDCSVARDLLELLAFLAPEAIPRPLLGAEPEALPEGLREEFDRDSAIEALHRFSLLRADPATLTVHGLVQAVTRDGLDAATAKAQAEAAVRLVKAALPRPPGEHTNWPAIGALLPHALATAEAAERLEAGLETAATVLNETALYHKARAAYAEAKPLYQRALAIREKVLGPEHPDVAQSLHNLAGLYQAQGRYGEAVSLLKRALAIREKILGPEHPDVAQSLNNLAVLYIIQGRFADAGPLLKRALAIREKILGLEHPDVAQSLHDLAVLYANQGRYGEAGLLYQRALAIREKVLGPEHPDVATSLHNLARLYHEQDRYGEAELLYQRALAIREKVFGSEHPDVATILHNLAGLYRVQGRFAEAKPLLRRALAIREKVLGPEHPDVARSLHNLALLCVNQGRSAEAEPLYQRALAIAEKTLGSEHPAVATILHSLAVLYTNQGRSAEAEPLFQRALAIREKVLGLEHPDVAQSLHDLAVRCTSQGRFAEAEPLYQRALAIREKVLGPEHPKAIETRSALSVLAVAHTQDGGP